MGTILTNEEFQENFITSLIKMSIHLFLNI